MEDFPVSLATLRDVPRIVGRGAYMTSVNHKSGYQHVRITEQSQRYFGIEWKGYFLVYKTLPFGFKASCFVEHTLSSMLASYARGFGVPTLVYIDDGFNSEATSNSVPADGIGCQSKLEGYHREELAVYVMCGLWCRLGYTLSLSKSVLVPTQVLRFLGMLVDSLKGAFVLPEDNMRSFAAPREEVLAQKCVGVKTLQKLQGKCISFTLAVPALRLYISEMSRSIAKALKNSWQVRVDKDL